MNTSIIDTTYAYVNQIQSSMSATDISGNNNYLSARCTSFIMFASQYTLHSVNKYFVYPSTNHARSWNLCTFIFISMSTHRLVIAYLTKLVASTRRVRFCHLMAYKRSTSDNFITIKQYDTDAMWTS